METMASDMRRALNKLEEMVKKLQQPTRRYVENVRAVLQTLADIYDHPSQYFFILDMLGLEATNIKVSGKKKVKEQPEKLEEAVKPIRIERRRARYLRKFTLPSDANPEDVKATYRDGVLTIDIAKKKEAKPKIVRVPIS